MSHRPRNSSAFAFIGLNKAKWNWISEGDRATIKQISDEAMKREVDVLAQREKGIVEDMAKAGANSTALRRRSTSACPTPSSRCGPRCEKRSGRTAWRLLISWNRCKASAEKAASAMRQTTVLSTINWWCALAAGVILVIGLAAVLYAVTARSLFNEPAAWAFDLTSYGLLFVVFLASPRTLEQDGHVRIDFLLSRLSDRPKRWTEVLMQTLSLVFLLLLLWATGQKTLESIEGDWVSPSMYEFPLRYVYWIMPVGVMLMVFSSVLKLCAVARHAWNSQSS